MTFLEQLDPELAGALEAAPEIDLGRNIPKLRMLIERFEAPLRAALPSIPEVDVTDHLAPSADGTEIRVRVYARPDRRVATSALLWIHGGGMVLGTIDGDDFMCKTWARDFGCVVASVDYRLAPEHQYPAHVEDCYAGLQWLRAHLDELGIDSRRVAIGGASAGGGLAAGTALLARDRGEVPLCFQYLVYPMIDDRDETPSTREITFPKVWNRVSNQHGWKAYLGDRVGRADVPIYAAPARAEVDDLRGLPPAYIDVGELDPFRDEDIAYATRLLAAGVPCELHVTPGAFHGSEMSVPDAPTSRRIRSYRRDALSRLLSS
jgi:acetyl esterase/lipase